MAMSPRLLRPLASGFDPRRIASLAYWLDATDASTVTTVSGNVSEWRSKAGSSLVASQGVALNRPTYTIAGRNNRNVVTFDGTNDFFSTSTLSLNQPFTVFWAGSTVGQPAAGATPARGTYICDGATSDTRVAIGWNAAGTTSDNGRLFAFAGSVLQPSAGGTAYNAWSVVSTVFDGASSQMRVNGSQVATGSIGATNIAALILGRRFVDTGGTYFEGPWGALLIYNRVLSASEIAKVEDYLGKLFAVTVA